MVFCHSSHLSHLTWLAPHPEAKPIRKYYCPKTLMLLVGICITHQLVIDQYAIIPHIRVTMSISCRASLQSLQNNTGTPKKLKSQRPFKIHTKTFINRFLHVYNNFYPNCQVFAVSVVSYLYWVSASH